MIPIYVIAGDKLSVPSEYLQDWFKRRTKNNIINRRLIQDAENGILTYFCEGHDDNSKHSQLIGSGKRTECICI